MIAALRTSRTALRPAATASVTKPMTRSFSAAAPSGFSVPLPKFRTVVLLGAGAAGAGSWALNRWMEKMHQSDIIWHGADQGAAPPTSQFFVRGEVGENPELRRVWRTTTDDNFNREGDEKISAEGQQATV